MPGPPVAGRLFPIYYVVVMRIQRHLVACGLLGFLAASASAQTGAPLLVEPMKPNDTLYVDGNAYLFENVNTSDGYSAQVSMFESKGRFRLMPRERFDPRVGYEARYYDFDSANPAIPDHAIDHSFGASVGLIDYEGWVGGISLGVGYASTNAYNDGNGLYGKATLGLGRKLDEKSYLAIALDYDGNRSFMPDVPLPAIIYTRQMTDELELAVGVPFAHIKWKPNDKFTATLRYLLPEDIEADVGYKVTNTAEVFANLSAQRRGFHDNDLEDSSDRIFFIQRRAEAGLRILPSEDCELIIAGGYAFHQSFEVGFDMRDTDEVAEISDAAYGRVGFTLRF